MDKNKKFGAATLVSGMALTCMLAPPAFADTITMQIYAAEAPNADGSLSYNGWAANAITAIENNQTSAGTPGTPTYFQEINQASGTGNIVTSFPSWNGVANPGAPYSQELGNRLTYILVAKDSSGPNINLAQVRGTMSSTDAGNVFGFTFNWANGVGTFGSPPMFFNLPTDYSAEQIGLITGNPTPVTSGPNTQNVNELIVVGFGNALANTSSSACEALGATQAAISCVKAEYNALLPFNMTANFTLTDGENILASGSESVGFVPEPGTLALFGTAIASLGLIGKRRKKA